MSLYDELEISRDANESDIKKAYRAMSLRHHPDRQGGNAEKFKKISEAYEILSDSQKRAQYDQEGTIQEDGFRQEMRPEDFHNINQIFTHILGGHGGMGPNIRIHRMGGMGGMGGMPDFPGFGGIFHSFISPPTIQLQVAISLEQAFTGCVMPIKFEKFVVQNDKRFQRQEEMCVEIPEGVCDSETIVLEKCGNEVNGVPGDVRVIIHVQNTTVFLRENLNLVYPKTISLKEALCGFSFDIPLLTGISLTIKNIHSKKVIKPGFRQVCHGYGMKRDGQTGNLMIEFQVSFPESLTPSQIETLNNCL